MFCQQSFFLARRLSILRPSSHQKWKSLLDGYQRIFASRGCGRAVAEEAKPPARPALPAPLSAPAALPWRSPASRKGTEEKP